jgi:hypothetical protein
MNQKYESHSENRKLLIVFVDFVYYINLFQFLKRDGSIFIKLGSCYYLSKKVLTIALSYEVFFTTLGLKRERKHELEKHK